MYHGQMTRERAIKEAGLAAVKKVESLNCEPTNRLDDQLTITGEMEWSTCVDLEDGRILTAYYYTDADDQQKAEDTGDWGSVDWNVHGYDIE